MPVMLRLDPEAWREFQAQAAARDLMPAQLIRIVMREWLDGYYSSLKKEK